MNTVEQIMEIVSDYASEIADIASSESVFAHIGKSRYAYRDKTLAELRTAIEELAADAERYNWLLDRAQEGYGSSEGCHNKDAYLVITGYEELFPMTVKQKREAVDAAMREST